MKNIAGKYYGYGGNILRVNLTTGKIWTEPTEKYAKRWIGGRAINTWILLNELNLEIKWSDSENILTFGVGVLVGTLAAGACRVSVDTKNVFNNGIGSANMGGFFGAELKFAGFDRNDDYPCNRYYNEPVRSGPYKGESIDHDIWDRMLDTIYKLHEWDIETSWQTRKGLEKIGLGDVADKLEKGNRLK